MSDGQASDSLGGELELDAVPLRCRRPIPRPAGALLSSRLPGLQAVGSGVNVWRRRRNGSRALGADLPSVSRRSTPIDSTFGSSSRLARGIQPNRVVSPPPHHLPPTFQFVLCALEVFRFPPPRVRAAGTQNDAGAIRHPHGGAADGPRTLPATCSRRLLARTLARVRGGAPLDQGAAMHSGEGRAVAAFSRPRRPRKAGRGPTGVSLVGRAARSSLRPARHGDLLGERNERRVGPCTNSSGET